MKRLFFVCLTFWACFSVCYAQKSKSRSIYTEEENVWVGEKEFLYCLNKATGDTKVFAIPNYTSDGVSKKDEIFCVNRMGDEILLGTRGNGVVCLSLADNTFDRLMSMQWVYTTIYDNDKDELWVGTISRLYNISDTKTNYLKIPGAAFASDFFITDILIDDYNTVWISNKGGSGDVYMSKYDAEEDVVSDVLDFSKYDYLRKIECDKDGVLWIASSQNGLLKYEKETVVVYNTSNSLLPNNSIKDLQVASSGLVWMISGDKLVSFDGTSFVSHLISEYDRFLNVAVDGDIVWVSSATALYSYHPESGQFEKKIDFAVSISGVEMVTVDGHNNNVLYDISGKRVDVYGYGKIVITPSRFKIILK